MPEYLRVFDFAVDTPSLFSCVSMASLILNCCVSSPFYSFSSFETFIPSPVSSAISIHWKEESTGDEREPFYMYMDTRSPLLHGV